MQKRSVTNSHKAALAKQIGERIKLARGETSRADLSERVELHANTIGNIEHGKTAPDCVQLIALASVLGVTPTWLLLGEGAMRATADTEVKAQHHNTPTQIKSIQASAMETILGSALAQYLGGQACVSIQKIEFGQEAGNSRATTIQLMVTTGKSSWKPS
jgi:transcriptional regulator with XRE-family HTH domain